MEKLHKKLKVWQEAMRLVKTVYTVTEHIDQREKHGLISQMRRAAISVPCNIAEGAARQGSREAIQFYIIARGSLSELDTQMELCKELALLKDSDVLELSHRVDVVDALLNGFIRYRRKMVKAEDVKQSGK